MKLSSIARKVAFKKLAKVDLPQYNSNQHEFNGDRGLKEFFGAEKRDVDVRCVYLGDEYPLFEMNGTFTWYDSRASHPTRSEYRFYYPAIVRPVFEHAEIGDSMFLFELIDESYLIVCCPAASQTAHLLAWLFTNNDLGTAFAVSMELELVDAKSASQLADLFEQLGVVPDVQDDSLEDAVERTFPDRSAWPTGKQIAEFAWAYDPAVDARKAPDEAVSHWLDLEYSIFRLVEKHRIESVIADLQDSESMVEDFLKISLSIQNRRKSRAGKSLEYHLERVLMAHSVPYTSQAITELKKTVDFLVPGVDEYRDPGYPLELLHVIACKTTLKDRWRQVLSEAARVPSPFLFTTDAKISSDQIIEIIDSQVRLVLPKSAIAPYPSNIQKHLLDVETLLSLLPKR